MVLIVGPFVLEQTSVRRRAGWAISAQLQNGKVSLGDVREEIAVDPAKFQRCVLVLFDCADPSTVMVIVVVTAAVVVLVIHEERDELRSRRPAVRTRDHA